jgi:hypothetical protein
MSLWLWRGFTVLTFGIVDIVTSIFVILDTQNALIVASRYIQTRVSGGRVAASSYAARPIVYGATSGA